MVRKYNIANHLKRHTAVLEVHYFTCTACTWLKENRFVAERLVAWRFFTVTGHGHWSALCGRMFKEIPRNRLILTCGWPEVDLRLTLGSVHGTYCSNIEQDEQVDLTCWALPSAFITCISSENQWVRGSEAKYICIKGRKIPPLRNSTQKSVVCDFCHVKRRLGVYCKFNLLFPNWNYTISGANMRWFVQMNVIHMKLRRS